jgi:hypothetical protein
MRTRLLTYSTRSKYILAVILASLLALGLMVSPAFAQAEAGNANLVIVDCSQVQTAIAQQYNSGDAVAVSEQYGVAISAIAQDLDISQSQVNSCLGGVPPEGTTPENPTDENPTGETPTDENPTGETPTDGTTAPDSSVGAVDNPNDVLAGTISKGELVNTGGMPLSVAAASLALVAVGMFLAGTIIRRGR